MPDGVPLKRFSPNRNTAVIGMIFLIVIIVLIVLAATGVFGGKPSRSTEAIFVAGGKGNDTLLWSNDGETWNRGGGTVFSGEGRFVKYYRSEEIWLAAGSDDSSDTTILWSSDGKTWNTVDSGGFSTGTGANDGGFAIAYDKFSGNWVAVGESDDPNNTLQWSGDGKNWRESSSGGFTARGINVIFDEVEQLFVAVGIDDDNNATIKRSTDGKTWFNSSSGSVTFGAGPDGGGVSVGTKNQ